MESIAQFWPDFDSVITSAYGHGDEEMVKNTVWFTGHTTGSHSQARLYHDKGRDRGHFKAYQSKHNSLVTWYGCNYIRSKTGLL